MEVSTMNRILKLFIPKPATLANYAAKGIQEAINGSGKEELIAKYSNLANNATDVQKFITSILLDGKIDDIERDDIAKKIEPLMKTLVEFI